MTTTSEPYLPGGFTDGETYGRLVDPGACDGWMHAELHVPALWRGGSEVVTLNGVEAMGAPLSGVFELSAGGQAYTRRGREGIRLEIRSGGILTRMVRSFGIAEVSQRERLS